MSGELGDLFLEGQDQLTALQPQRLVAESDLQELLAEHPQLIPLQRVEPELTRAPLLIQREAVVAGMELDHLFVNEKAVPVFVECKRGVNRQSRREVVAQMIDYAANARVEWTAGELEAMLRARCEEQGLDADEQLAALEYAFGSDAEFWQQCEEHLRAGRMWLLFVADEINERLQRVVEFLNENMARATVLAMEVVRWTAGEQSMLQARLVGETEAAAITKDRSRNADVLTALIDGGLLAEGESLWVLPARIPPALRPADPADPRLRVELTSSGGRLQLQYAPASGEPITETPSKMINHVRRSFDPAHAVERFHAVHDKFSLEPGGPSLGEVAAVNGLWESE